MLVVIALGWASCSDDDPIPVNEEEVITTLTVTFRTGGGVAMTLQTRDLDGDGPNPPVITKTGDLAVNTVYDCTIELLNETETPAEDITEEIDEESAEHQFFFTTTNGIGTVAYDDMDGNGNPLGLAFTLTTAAAATGDLTIILRHEPDKDAAGVSDGDITNAGGETDIEVTFTGISVQ